MLPKVLALMKSHGVLPRVETCERLLGACVKAGAIDTAGQVLQLAQRSGQLYDQSLLKHLQQQHVWTPSCASQAEGSATLLVMELPSGSVVDATLDLGHVYTMFELQALVLGEWVSAGASCGEALVMEYVENGGATVRATRWATIEMLKASAELRLIPNRGACANSAEAPAGSHWLRNVL